MTISKRLCLFFLLVIHISLSQATDIIVDFTIISENTIPDSVWVHNTTKDSAIMLHNNTSLYLSYTSANINKPLTNDKLQLYPNPAQTQATIAYTATYNGMHHINITDMSGRTITSYSTNLSIGTHQFALPALTAANYCITVSSIQYTSSTILMSTYQGQTTDNTIKLTTSEAAGNELKSTTIESTLPYDIGDKLQLTAYLNKQNATLTISPQTSTTVDFDIVILRITLEEWENSNFPIYAEITVENGKDTLNINTENLDIFLTNLKDITVEDGKEINIKFDGATVSPENLKDIFDSGIDVELVNKNGDIYTMSGTFKTYILEDLYDFEENTIYNMDNPNINTSNNFDDMVLDFSDENGIFTSPNTDYINSYANNFGKRDIVGEEFDDIYFTDIYIYSGYYNEEYNIFYSLNDVFNITGKENIDYRVKSIGIGGGTIIEHADFIQNFKENSNMTDDEMLAAIDEGRISIYGCYETANVLDAVDENGDFVPYLKEAVIMAGDELERFGISTSSLPENHPLYGKMKYISAETAEFVMNNSGTPFLHGAVLDEDINVPDKIVDLQKSYFNGDIIGEGYATANIGGSTIGGGCEKIDNIGLSYDVTYTQDANPTVTDSYLNGVWTMDNSLKLNDGFYYLDNTAIPLRSGTEEAFIESTKSSNEGVIVSAIDVNNNSQITK